MYDQPFDDSHFTQIGIAFESLDDSITIVDAEFKMIFANSACETLFGYSKEELLGNPISMIVPHTLFTIATEIINSATGASRTEEITMVRKEGEEFSANFTVTPITDPIGDAIRRICVIRDLTLQKQAAAARQVTEQTVLADIGRAISSSIDIDTVFESFASEVRMLIPFDRITIDLNYAGGDTFRLAYMIGHDVPNRRIRDITSSVGTVTYEVGRTKSGLIVQSDNTDEILSRFPGLRTVIDAGLRSFLSVPLMADDRVIGILHLSSVAPKLYDESQIVLANSIANQITGTIINSELYIDTKRVDKALRDSVERYRLMFQEIYRKS